VPLVAEEDVNAVPGDAVAVRRGGIREERVEALRRRAAGERDREAAGLRDRASAALRDLLGGRARDGGRVREDDEVTGFAQGVKFLVSSC
jgi:hypothetical protein